jgi:hypothetical protein
MPALQKYALTLCSACSSITLSSGQEGVCAGHDSVGMKSRLRFESGRIPNGRPQSTQATDTHAQHLFGQGGRDLGSEAGHLNRFMHDEYAPCAHR